MNSFNSTITQTKINFNKKNIRTSNRIKTQKKPTKTEIEKLTKINIISPKTQILDYTTQPKHNIGLSLTKSRFRISPFIRRITPSHTRPPPPFPRPVSAPFLRRNSEFPEYLIGLLLWRLFSFAPRKEKDRPCLYRV